MINPTKARILENKDGSTRSFYQITYAKRSEEELYDVERDPHCLHDLAHNPECAETKDRLWERLKELLTEQGDPRMLGYGDIFDSYPTFGMMQPTIPGFKETGKYNAKFWPRDRGPVPEIPTTKRR